VSGPQIPSELEFVEIFRPSASSVTMVVEERLASSVVTRSPDKYTNKETASEWSARASQHWEVS
jgi:hypothetical protein